MKKPFRPQKNISIIRQSELERMARLEAKAVAAGVMPPGELTATALLARAGYRQYAVHIVNRPARYPHGSLWPIELRADMVAALLDFRTTHELSKALAAGEAPPPTATRHAGDHAEPIWYREAVLAFVGRRHGLGNTGTNGPAPQSETTPRHFRRGETQ